MTVETYQELAAQLGLDRGALVKGFTTDLPSVVPHDLGPSEISHVSKKAPAPPIEEDLTRFQKPDFRKGWGRGGARRFTPATRAFYTLLYQRTTSQDLAQALAVNVTGIGMAIRGHRHSGPVRARLLPLLTPEERAALPPMES